MARLAFDPHLDEYEKQLYHAHYLELKNLHRLLLKWETGIGVVENKAKLSTWISDLLFLCNRKLVVNRQSGGCFSMHRAPYCLYYFLVSLYYRGRKPGLGPKSARK